jgi:hypothetical protein
MYKNSCAVFRAHQNFTEFCSLLWALKSPDSSVGLGYGLDDRGSRVRFSAGAGNFPLHHRVQRLWGSFPGGKAAAA